MDSMHRQRAHALRLDWGLDGAAAVAEGADVAVVVDVLSFTTTVSVALDVSTAVLPYPWSDETAPAYARQHDAALAVGRSRARAGDVSLSPLTLCAGTPPARLVLPSPNGSTIAHRLGAAAGVCLAASLRNAAAVAEWIASRHAPDGASVAVVAAGEHWPGGGMRPAVEDLWGAGALIASLAGAGWSALSPEAGAARAAWRAAEGDALDALLACGSGCELVAKGYRADVEVAAEVNASRSVPFLHEHVFAPAPSARPSR